MWLKSIFGVAALLLPVTVAVGCWLVCARRETAQAQQPSSCNVACSLAPGELADRRARLARFRAAAREVTALASGYELRFDFDEETFREAASLVVDESRCCGFLEFRLTVRPARKSLAMEITGPAGTTEFLASVLGQADDAAAQREDPR